MEQADILFLTLHRESLLYADLLGLSLTASELREIKQRLILAWVVGHLGLAPTMTVYDYIEFTGGEEVAE